MRRSRRKSLSPSDYEWIAAAITETCQTWGVCPWDEDYRSAAKCRFFAVYYSHPLIGSPWFWEDAYQAMESEIRILKSQNEFCLYKALSLDAPFNQEMETPRLSLMPSLHGDPLPGIMLWDHLRGLSEDEYDLAFRLTVHRDNLEEARSHLGWDPGRLREAVFNLRESMTGYLAS